MASTPAHFSAPWGWKLKMSTALACFVLGVPAVFQLSQGHFIGVVLAFVLLATVPFVIRGYTVTPTHLEIHRLGWTTRWPLDGLLEVFARPGVMAWSWRVGMPTCRWQDRDENLWARLIELESNCETGRAPFEGQGWKLPFRPSASGLRT